jgi:hypothetical protein
MTIPACIAICATAVIVGAPVVSFFSHKGDHEAEGYTL